MSEVIYIKDGKAYLSEVADKLPEFKDLKESDKSRDKQWFHDVLMYIFSVYTFDGVLKNLYPEQRKEYTINDILENRLKLKDVENNIYVNRAITKYTHLTMGFIKRDYEQTKVDIESLNNHISKIPFVKKILMKNQTVSFEYKGEFVTAVLDVPVEIDNSKEKSDALKLKEVLYDLEEKLKAKIIKEDNLNENEGQSMIEQIQS